MLTHVSITNLYYIITEEQMLRILNCSKLKDIFLDNAEYILPVSATVDNCGVTHIHGVTFMTESCDQ